jgi:hypothetical protein
VALEAGQRHQRDVAAGQSTLFDLFAVPMASPETAAVGPGTGIDYLDGGEEIPRKERLRWEKELIGLYLSEHPLGEIADQLPDYVTAYTGDLAEEVDGAKLTLGGMVTATRRIITRAGSTMLVATLEDMGGSVEVVVFPKVFADTAPAWTDDAVLLVTGKLDKRDEGIQVLCEAVHAWDDAVRMGAPAFAYERDRLLRARGGNGRRGSWNGNGNGNGNGSGSGGGAGGVHAPAGVAPVTAERAAEPAALGVAIGEREPADDAPAPADAVPLQAVARGLEGTVTVSFDDTVSVDRLLPAVDSVTQLLRGRPGSFPVVLALPVAGSSRQVKLPHRVDWDERLVEGVRRAAGIPVRVELRPTTAEA